MTGNRKPLLFVAIALVAGAAGIFAAMSLAGSDGPQTKYYMQPVELDNEFVVNLKADDGAPHYAKLRVAVQLAPMEEDDRYVFLHGEGGGHGGGGEIGPDVVSRDAKLKNAVIEATSRFAVSDLQGAEGQVKLKETMLKEMQAAMASYKPVVVEGQTQETSGGIAGFLDGVFGGSDDKDVAAGEEDHSPLEPPFAIERVYFTEFAVQ